jgi:hypothetical protein
MLLIELHKLGALHNVQPVPPLPQAALPRLLVLGKFVGLHWRVLRQRLQPLFCVAD